MPLPVDALTRAAQNLGTQFTEYKTAGDAALAAIVANKADVRGIYQPDIDNILAEAEAKVKGFAEGNNWIGGAATRQVAELARDTTRRLNPLLGQVDQVNASVTHAQTLNMLPAEREARLRLIDRQAREARESGTLFTGRQFIGRPDIVKEMSVFAGNMAAAEVRQLGITKVEMDMIRTGNVESLPSSKLQALMNVYLATNPDTLRYINESIEASGTEMSNDEFLSSMGFNGATGWQKVIADKMSYERENVNLSNAPAPRAPADGDGSDASAVPPSVPITVNPLHPGYTVGTTLRSIYARRRELAGPSGEYSDSARQGVLGQISRRAEAEGWKLVTRNGRLVIADRKTSALVTGGRALDILNEFTAAQAELRANNEVLDEARRRFPGTPTSANLQPATGWRGMLQNLGNAVIDATGLGREGVDQMNRNLASRSGAVTYDTAAIDNWLGSREAPAPITVNAVGINDPTDRAATENWLVGALPDLMLVNRQTGEPLDDRSDRSAIMGANPRSPQFFFRGNRLEMTFNPAYATGVTGPDAGTFSAVLPESSIATLSQIAGPKAMLVRQVSQGLSTAWEGRRRGANSANISIKLQGEGGREVTHTLGVTKSGNNWTLYEVGPDGRRHEMPNNGFRSPQEAIDALSSEFISTF